ncbi:AMIN-like domain-containing (lipo)protein [Streptomyces lavendulocolor]|uniref:AMIN-like domain-containing (lipo)protein n=1 Tax=Streptomyces lavendulocolor TaxID=67316 RepID=UPI003F4D46A0
MILRTPSKSLAGISLAICVLSLGATPAEAASCRIRWGSLTKAAPSEDYRSLVNIRTGPHACFDRMVFDVRSGAANTKIGYRVQYVRRVLQDGSGDSIRVQGGAVLEVRISAPSYDIDSGQPTYKGRPGQPLPHVKLVGYRTFRDARFVGSFEGDTQVGLGVRARLPFRVFRLDHRVVLDVAHTW